MSQINKDQLDNASKFMGAIWTELIKPFYNADKTDEYWLKLINKEADLYERYDLGNNKQLLELMFGFTCGLEIEAGSRRASYLEKFYNLLSGREVR